MRHGDMGDEARAEKALLSGKGAVNELIDDHEGSGCQLFPERTARREGNDVRGAGSLHRIDVGAVVDRRWRLDVPSTMAWQEQKVDTLKFSEKNLV